MGFLSILKDFICTRKGGKTLEGGKEGGKSDEGEGFPSSLLFGCMMTFFFEIEKPDYNEYNEF